MTVISIFTKTPMETLSAEIAHNKAVASLDLTRSFDTDTQPNRWGEITPDEYLRLAIEGHKGTEICWPAIDIMADVSDTIALQQ